MHIVDSHAHLDFQTLADDLDGVLARAIDADVKTILAVGIGDGPDTMHRARDLASRFAGHGNIPASLLVPASIRRKRMRQRHQPCES